MRQLPPVIAADGQQEFNLSSLTESALITLNGVILQPADFTIDGERVTLVAPVGAGDEVGAIIFWSSRR